ncbi:DNA-binding protein [Carnobacterium maltaromaticum]|uniref:phage antirepressor KilAC domain-containing protein n=1 Tax=Carnobacterium maltaromaticum TaxID=2751 RepID=UPI000C76FEDF|nr:phage antirepressor KilAC domain-containing protein [Carnobacterium maltaromaticum]PLS36824.1 DNA-binding protein [Carnobacterium maltaromaticum]PLS37639.1 DNA-binding protein [Carnobacterium maltaromaticum]PLS39581.1 DNA-binding protein [Carnobacterium maltaromaticum]PLS44336.1 DNA-binding protein [Carnobacterium maltaromaticum]PLS46370.1 DNA-binding protein [Carnobacterium maltaromaticum]
MPNLQKFNNELFQIEVKAENGESLFDVESVARSLGITDTKNNKEYVRWARVNEYLGNNSPQVAKGSFISEPMVYKLAFKANNEVAEKFQDWLAVEVLPSIRKNGMYATDELLDNPDLLIEVATKLKEERTLRLVAEQRVAEYEPKISYLDSILESTDTVTITQIAADYGLSAVAMNKRLNELKIQHKVGGQWILYTRHQREGYTKSHTTRVPKADGKEKVVMNTKWTQKGRLFIYESLKEINVYPLMDIEQLQLA